MSNNALKSRKKLIGNDPWDYIYHKRESHIHEARDFHIFDRPIKTSIITNL
jgi:hypothetical protein